MKNKILSLLAFSVYEVCSAQNAGIGTTNPNAYGHGGTNVLLEIRNAATPSNSQAHLILSTGSTVATGSVGSITWSSPSLTSVDKRLSLVATSYDASSTAAAPSANMLFYTTNGGTLAERIRLTYDGKLGIGISNPNAPLSFAPVLGKKITLFPGPTGDVGFAVANNRLQIYSDNPNADVAIGYDAAGAFIERFAVKPNGSLAINGNPGATGEVLTSNGGSGLAAWGSPTKNLYNNTLEVGGTNTVSIPDGGTIDIPGLTYTFTATTNVKVILNYNVPVSAPGCAFCGSTHAYIYTNVDGTLVSQNSNFVPNDQSITLSGSTYIQLSPGTHTIKLVGHAEGPPATFGVVAAYFYHNEMIIQVIPE